jgi:signal transduction histidine kinase
MEAEGAVHDLKSPVSTAISLLGMVRYRHRDEPEAMALVKNETMMKQLLHEIEALGDVMREGKTQIVVHREPTDLVALAGRVKQELDFLFQNKRHEITIINELPMGYLVNVDGNLVERILRNLMENAVKYADEGVNVYVRLRQQGEGVLVEVEDNGWGIAPQDQKKIFKPYYRVSQPSGHHRRGSGIGLANARQLVKAHGGVIKLQSQPGKGSVFSFTLEDLSAEK